MGLAFLRLQVTFTVTVNWGDGSNPSIGSVSSFGQAAGNYTVSGQHLYTTSGSYTANLIVNDVGGSASSASIPVTINPAKLTLSLTPFVVTEKSAFTGQVATFTSANSLALATDFQAVINWGDGAVTNGSIVTLLPGFGVLGTHSYLNSGNYPVSVVVQSNEGVIASSSGVDTVGDRLIPITGGLVLPGGRAPEYLRNKPKAVAITRHFVETGKPIATNCHGPLLVIAAGGAKGKTMTCYADLEPEVRAAGAEFVNRDVVVDGSLVSVRGWPDNGPWMREFVKLLKSRSAVK